MKKQIFLFAAIFLYAVSGFSQGDMIDYLLRTETIKKYKEAKANVEEITNSAAFIQNLTEEQFYQLKSEYDKVYISFNSFVMTMGDDLKSKDSLNAMKQNPLRFVVKYDQALNIALDSYNQGFMPVYMSIIYGKNAKPGFLGIFAASVGKFFVEKLVDIGVSIAMNIIVNKFIKPLQLPPWEDVVVVPNKFAESFEYDGFTEVYEPVTNPSVLRTNASGQYEEPIRTSKPMMGSISGKIKLIQENGAPMYFSWLDARKTKIGSTGGTSRVSTSSNNNDYLTMAGGDFLESNTAYGLNTYFQVKVNTNAIFCLFGYSSADNSIVHAYPFPKIGSTGETNKVYADNGGDEYITLPRNDRSTGAPNYFYTSDNTEYEYLIVLVSNTTLDFNSVYQKILAESGPINERVNNALYKSGLAIDNKFNISEADGVVHFNSNSTEASVLPLIFAIKRK